MRKKMVLLTVLALCLTAAKKEPSAHQQESTKADNKASEDEPLRIATAYLNALEGSGHDYARTYLLGDVTLDAAVWKIPNWKIQSRQKERTEKGKVAAAIAAMHKLDKAGSKLLRTKFGLKSAAEIKREQVKDVLPATKKQSEAFLKKFPLFAKAARADSWVYWHPQNPWRLLLKDLGQKGEYQLFYHHFEIEERGKKGKGRVWPLRVLRIKTTVYDSGWKILPASDWDPSL